MKTTLTSKITPDFRLRLDLTRYCEEHVAQRSSDRHDGQCMNSVRLLGRQFIKGRLVLFPESVV